MKKIISNTGHIMVKLDVFKAGDSDNKRMKTNQ